MEHDSSPPPSDRPLEVGHAASTALPRAVQRMLDEHAIRNLVHEYADAFLAKDAARLKSLFATDTPPAVPPDFDSAWADGPPTRWGPWGPTLLHVTTQWATFDDDDNARGRVQCIVQMDRAEGFVDQTVLYEDVYVRRGDRWLFATRSHKLWFGQVRPVHPMDQPTCDFPRSQIGAGTLPEDLERLYRESAG
jgi:hypothetical protein